MKKAITSNDKPISDQIETFNATLVVDNEIIWRLTGLKERPEPSDIITMKNPRNGDMGWEFRSDNHSYSVSHGILRVNKNSTATMTIEKCITDEQAEDGATD